MASKEFMMFQNWDEEKKERALLELLNEVPLEVSRAARKKRTERVPIQDYIQEAIKIRNIPKGTVHGLSSGISSIDDLTAGMSAGELIVLSGPTSAGKTQLATHITYNVALAKHKVTFVTMEMTKAELTSRVMDAAGNELEKLDHGAIEYQKADDLAALDIAFLVQDAVKDGAELIVIDHLHYFGTDTGNEAQVYGEIVKNFKQAAVKNNIPIILICHIRKLQRDGQKPTANDLRDSSLIGQHADQIIMVWRDLRPDAADSNEVEVSNWKNRLRGLHPGRRKRNFHARGGILHEGTKYECSNFDCITDRSAGSDPNTSQGQFGEVESVGEEDFDFSFGKR